MASEVPEGQPIKLTITHYRKPEHTHAAFIKWIVEGHIPLALSVFKKHGVIDYSLFITPPSLNNALKQEFSAHQPTWDFAESDCFIEYIMPSMDVLRNIMTDPDWQVAIKDQPQWVDIPRALVSIGYSTGNVLDGKPVVLPN